jgi:hypothetical protein
MSASSSTFWFIILRLPICFYEETNDSSVSFVFGPSLLVKFKIYSSAFFGGDGISLNSSYSFFLWLFTISFHPLSPKVP